MAKKTEDKKTEVKNQEEKKTKTRKSDEELLKLALARVDEINARIARKALSQEQKDTLRKGRSPLINFVNKLELGEVKVVIELLRENGYPIDIKDEAAKILGMEKTEKKEEPKEEPKPEEEEEQEPTEESKEN